MIRKVIRHLRKAQFLSFGNWFRYAVALPGRRVRISLYGKPLVIRKNTPDIKVAIISLGAEFEPVSNLLPADFDGLIVDAGGYIGTAAMAMSCMYPHATVVSVEPSTKNAEIFRENTRTYSNIHLVQAALTPGGEERINLFNRGTGEWGYTVVSTPLDHPNAAEIESVPTVTLKELSQRFGGKPIGILKLDIEGSEKDLIDREAEVLKTIPVIFAELHDRIVDGCTESFQAFSKNRWLVKAGGEKYLSLLKD